MSAKACSPAARKCVLSSRSSGGYPLMASSGKTTIWAPRSVARARYSSILRTLPSMSPTVVSICARAIRRGFEIEAINLIVGSTSSRPPARRARQADRSRLARQGKQEILVVLCGPLAVVATFHLDVVCELLEGAAEAGQLQPPQDLLGAAVHQRANAQAELAVTFLELDRGMTSRDVGADVRSDRVRHEHCVREAVEREVDTGGQHRRQPAEHGGQKRSWSDRDACMVRSDLGRRSGRLVVDL